MSLWFTLGALFLLEGVISGQTEAPAAAGGKAVDQGSILDDLLPEVIYLPNKDNVLVPIPRDATIDKFLEFLKRSRELPQAAPAPAIASLEMTGSADEERATLTAKIVVQSINETEFVPLPLGFHEAVLRDWSYEGQGEFLFKSNDRSQGYTWWLKGKGKHLIQLDFSVPVKKQAGNRRLQVSVPDATVSRLKLTTNHRNITAKSTNGELQVIQPPEESARIELLGIWPRLDLTWQPVVAASPTPAVIDAETTILVHADNEKLWLESFQRIQVNQGSIAELSIQLPAQSELLSIEGRDYQSHRVSADNPRQVLVKTSAASAGQVQLKWTVRLKPSEQQTYVVEGFQVDGARTQNGHIGLITADGVRYVVSNADQPQLLRINAAELRPLSAQVSRAWRFFSQPFRMTIKLEAIEPYITSEPRLVLNVTQESVDLDGQFTLQVLRGKTQFLELNWANWKANGWILDSIEPRAELVTAADPETSSMIGQMRLKFSDEVSERFVLRLKAHCPLRKGEATPLSLPFVLASDVTAAVLKLSEAENMMCELTPVGETVLNSIPPENGPGAPAADSDSLKTRMYHVPSSESSFTLKAKPQERRVQVTSATRVRLVERELQCRQKLSFDVRHERLAQFGCVVPEGLAQEGLRVFLDDETELPAQWSAPDASGMTSAQITLPEPRLGQFTVELRFSLPLTERAASGESPVALPLVSLQDLAIAEYAVQTETSENFRISVLDPNWKPKADLTTSGWSLTDAEPYRVMLRLEAGGNTGELMVIDDVNLEMEWDRQGVIQCRADYRLSGSMLRLQMQLPPGASLQDVTWQDEPLRDGLEIVTENPAGQYLLKSRHPASDQGQQRLSVRYRLPAQRQFGLWNRWTLSAPQLQQCRWAARAQWRVRFPSQQHLFAYAETVTPVFSWRNRGLYWSRTSPGQTEVAAESSAKNSYVFQQFGELRSWEIVTMSGPMILFVGALISLITGFCLLNFRVFRNLMTVWAVVFAVAVLGMLFPPQVELLLQPVLAGFLLPVVAVWMQYLRRRTVSPVLSFDPMMDLEEPMSSVNRPRVSGESPDSYSGALRSPSGSTHDFLRAETGSGVS